MLLSLAQKRLALASAKRRLQGNRFHRNDVRVLTDRVHQRVMEHPLLMGLSSGPTLRETSCFIGKGNHRSGEAIAGAL